MNILKLKYIIFFFFIGFYSFVHAQQPQPKIIDTFEINTGKIVLYDNNSWAFIEEIEDSVRKDDKNEFNATWLYKQEKKNKTTIENKAITSSEKKIKHKANKGEKGVYVTIKKGDNLYNLAKKNQTTVDKICYLNGIDDNIKLKIGQKIRVK